jgi:outer membrane protein TolC
LTLRRQALEEHLTPQVTMQRLKRFQTARQLQLTEQQLKALQQNYAELHLRYAVGADSNVELLRLRVQVLEAEQQLRFLQERLQELRKPE